MHFPYKRSPTASLDVKVELPDWKELSPAILTVEKRSPTTPKPLLVYLTRHFKHSRQQELRLEVPDPPRTAEQRLLDV